MSYRHLQKKCTKLREEFPEINCRGSKRELQKAIDKYTPLYEEGTKRKLVQSNVNTYTNMLFKMAYHPSWILWVKPDFREDVEKQIRKLYEKLEEMDLDRVHYDDLLDMGVEKGDHLYADLLQGYTEDMMNLIDGTSWGEEIVGVIVSIIEKMLKKLGVEIYE